LLKPILGLRRRLRVDLRRGGDAKNRPAKNEYRGSGFADGETEHA
jgi:hypothetical protein